MTEIYKIRSHPVIDFAAEELKKYLRMMMPESGSFPIEYNPDAKSGFRLGLLSDFNLPYDCEDANLDDVVHVDTQVKINYWVDFGTFKVFLFLFLISF